MYGHVAMAKCKGYLAVKTNHWSLGKQFCFPSSLDVSLISLDFVSRNLQIIGKIKLFPSAAVISVYYMVR